ncbi:MAG TPA: hypothetical protein VD813_05610 [Pseudonocardia sp.]|nr:hypothetical protein [Pseudonocardia sp.]
MTSDDQLDLEFAYTSHRDSCRDPYSPLRYCRRPTGHAGRHASGYGSHRTRWEDHREQPGAGTRTSGPEPSAG